MAIASGSQRRIALIVESAWATTPSTPTFRVLRATGGGLRTNKRTAISNEIRADRNVPDVILLGQSVAGSYNFEASYGTFDLLLEGALMGAWATDVLKNGVTPKSFTVEETLELGSTDSYQRMVGATVDQFSLAIAAQEIITGQVGMMAKQETLATAIIAGATYNAPNDKAVLSASAHFASLSLLGLSPLPLIRSIDLEIRNNLRERIQVGSQFTEEFGAGRCEVSGRLSAYFTSNALYQQVLDHGSGALEFTIGAETGEKYTIELPKIILGDGERDSGDNSSDVMVNIPFQAVYDAGEACSIKITRAVA